MRGARDERDGDAGSRGGAREGRVGEPAGRKAEEARRERQGRAEHKGAEVRTGIVFKGRKN